MGGYYPNSSALLKRLAGGDDFAMVRVETHKFDNETYSNIRILIDNKNRRCPGPVFQAGRSGRPVFLTKSPPSAGEDTGKLKAGKAHLKLKMRWKY